MGIHIKKYELIPFLVKWAHIARLSGFTVQQTCWIVYNLPMQTIDQVMKILKEQLRKDGKL